MSRKKAKQIPKRVLHLPDLDFAKSAVLNTLRSSESKRSYRFAIDDFVAWYCSEPRLAFSKTVVLRYRLELESRRLSSSTMNLRLAAVRRLAYEATDTGGSFFGIHGAGGDPASSSSAILPRRGRRRSEEHTSELQS